jgi:hypothetical protein
MMPSPSILHRNTCYSRRLAAGSTTACVGRPDSPAAALLIRSRNPRSTSSRPHAHTFLETKQSRLPLQSNHSATHDAAKSP